MSLNSHGLHLSLLTRVFFNCFPRSSCTSIKIHFSNHGGRTDYGGTATGITRNVLYALYNMTKRSILALLTMCYFTGSGKSSFRIRPHWKCRGNKDFVAMEVTFVIGGKSWILRLTSANVIFSVELSNTCPLQKWLYIYFVLYYFHSTKWDWSK